MALAAGCEMMERASRAANPSMRNRGFHTTPNAGVFGSTIAAAKMLKLNAAKTVSALGMAMIIPALFGVGNAGTLTFAALFLVLFGLGWGFFDCNNMPILSQIVRPELRATGYGIMNMVSISCGGFADWGFGALRDRYVPLYAIFGVFAGLALISVVIVLCIRPRPELASEESSA